MLFDVGRRLLRVEGVQPSIVRLLRKDGGDEFDAVVLINGQIKLRERIESLRGRVVVWFDETRDAHAREAILERLQEEEPVTNDGAAEGHARSK